MVLVWAIFGDGLVALIAGNNNNKGFKTAINRAFKEF
jgi:hypothetical protein